MIKYFCDRCEKQVSYSYELTRIIFLNIKSGSENKEFVGHLCDYCCDALRDFMRPLPKIENEPETKKQ